jgi:hypothetical protein
MQEAGANTEHYIDLQRQRLQKVDTSQVFHVFSRHMTRHREAAGNSKMRARSRRAQ